MDYSDYEGLHRLISVSLKDDYAIASANIARIEELSSRNGVVYIAQLRDALTHLVSIYSVDDIISSKEYVLDNLERMREHIERVVLDSFRKLCSALMDVIETTKPRDFAAIRAQIALKIAALRLGDASVSFEDKKKSFHELVNLLEEIVGV